MSQIRGKKRALPFTTMDISVPLQIHHVFPGPKIGRFVAPSRNSLNIQNIGDQHDREHHEQCQQRVERHAALVDRQYHVRHVPNHDMSNEHAQLDEVSSVEPCGRQKGGPNPLPIPLPSEDLNVLLNGTLLNEDDSEDSEYTPESMDSSNDDDGHRDDEDDVDDDDPEDPEDPDDEAPESHMTNYYRLLYSFSKQWLSIQLTHRVSITATDTFWNLAFSGISELLSFRDEHNICKKIPKFQNQRKQLYKKECPKISLIYAYLNKETDRIHVVSNVESAPMKIYQNSRRYMKLYDCLLYTSPSPRDRQKSRMPSSA